MEEILDKDVLGESLHDDRCKSLRVYTLLFSGLMAITYLVFNLMHWPHGRKCLYLGILAITAQSLFCFLVAKKKTWRAGLQALIAVAFTTYLFFVLFR